MTDTLANQIMIIQARGFHYAGGDMTRWTSAKPIYINYCRTMRLNGRKPETCHPSSIFKSCTGFSSITRSNIGGRCGLQVLDPTVAWILSRVGPTIRRGRGYPYLIVRLWSPIFVDYLSSSAVTIVPWQVITAQGNTRLVPRTHSSPEWPQHGR